MAFTVRSLGINMRQIGEGEEQGSLLLDTMTAIIIICIAFAIAFPNYMRGIYENRVASDSQILDVMNIATQRYASDHAGLYPTAGTAISTTVPGITYLPDVPKSPIGTSSYIYGTAPQDGAPYVIVDQNVFGGSPSTSTDPTLLYNYKRHSGSACAAGDRLATDPIHNTYCATTSGG
jgi:type II secretory pathway pseudopilin PulG